MKGTKTLKRWKRFLRFRSEAQKEHGNVKNVSKTCRKRSGGTRNALKTFPGTTKTQKTFQKRPRGDENVPKTFKKPPERRKRIGNVSRNVVGNVFVNKLEKVQKNVSGNALGVSAVH